MSLYDFLEVPYRPLTSQLMKINPESLQQIATNYDVLAACSAQE
jgi:hypothetical protein